MNTASLLDFCNEDTIDATGEFFRAIETFDEADSVFEAAVPPHLSEESVAHWDGPELY